MFNKLKYFCLSFIQTRRQKSMTKLKKRNNEQIFELTKDIQQFKTEMNVLKCNQSTFNADFNYFFHRKKKSIFVDKCEKRLYVLTMQNIIIF
ncbi:hypothetical protein RFI_31505 [Reticulomyxa filosa]|uniref:Uncharacterized protein n=1 Tax=Reticulomyxa filosa TaxID=46433 RepID=X6LX40_RETFI|nr:hypothetical protein RFI_31505 [Reticulomyxa filosa]|eukprot:ETO05891.1 hypothetical protein RFI_31505 [Reticulomyxa filosa]